MKKKFDIALFKDILIGRLDVYTSFFDTYLSTY